jgi:predicted nucleotidyltransferase
VHVPEGTGLLALGRFTQELEDLLRVPVDVVPMTASSPASATASTGTSCRCEP